jgi:hypothetical protein
MAPRRESIALLMLDDGESSNTKLGIDEQSSTPCEAKMSIAVTRLAWYCMG